MPIVLGVLPSAELLHLMKPIFFAPWVRNTSWVLLLIQMLTPISLSISSVAYATELSNNQDTLTGMQAVIDGRPAYDINSLPSLGSGGGISAENHTDNDPLERSAASGASRVGQLLSADDSTRATTNYAKGIAESLINNEINDWLNQKGNGRVSVGSDKTISGDVLFALNESDNSLLFTQGGLRTKEDRNTVNLGLGYRQYVGDWMYGINSFYDYDYTGKNARLGVGTEAWTDYLKLAANGYFGLTDWHQSRISSMRDFDERPANGFDVRLEAWLPNWPQLGGKLKYEQYFGKGIDLETGSVSPDKLKDNPIALTAGLTYTPFPLISFSGERSIGDRSQTRIGMDLNYRFGIPLHQQLNADSVDLMRSLAGNRYELVDRNYDIVMQYRKQELLRISLPETINAQAADTVRIPVTVHKAKYGLKDTEWTPSAEFVTNGGLLHKISATEMEVKIPAYAWNIRTGQAQEYILQVVGTDINGNRSNPAKTLIRVAPSSNVINSLTVSPDGAVIADNVQSATLTATVTDEAGQPLAAQSLNFSVSGLTDAQGNSAATLFTHSTSDATQLAVVTDARGQAQVRVRSKIAKAGTVTVKMDNGNYKTAQLQFIADATTAALSALKITKDNAFADGVSADELVASVQDAHGNPLENFVVSADVDNDGVVDTSGTTNIDGNTTLKVVNEHAGTTNVTVRAGTGTYNVLTERVHFVVDKSVAQVTEGDLVVSSGAIANGTDSNAVSVKITDGRGNAVAGVNLQLSVAEGASLSATKLESGPDGTANTTITSLRAGRYAVNVTILESGNAAQAATEFIADDSTAEVTDANFIITPDGAVADGVDKNGVHAIVTDANGNLVAGAQVSFAVSAGATINTLTGMTGEDGKATAEVSSMTAGTYQVTVMVNGREAQKNTTFVADNTTAKITQAGLVIIPDGSVADGKAKNGVAATVTDANGNLVSGATVSFSVENDAVITAINGTTGADGTATADVTSTVAGTYIVTATVNGNATQKNTTFVADSTTAEITEANLTISPDGSVADGVAKNGVVAIVTDANGNPVTGAEVNFSLSSGHALVTTLIGTTGTDGKATATVTSTTAGTFVITAKVNDNETHKNTTFVADSTTAEIKKASLTIDPDGSVADGEAKNRVTAVVTDAHDNLVPGATVNFSVENGAMITVVSGTTGSDGKAMADITSREAGSYAVTATVNGQSVQTETLFVADNGTADIMETNMHIDPDGSVANGVEKNTVTVVVTDAQDNVVPNIEVNFSVNGGATIVPVSRVTDTNGKVAADITATAAGTFKVTASVNGNKQVKDTTFVADSVTAEITDANLIINPDNAIANGVAKNGVTAIVTDANNNLVPGLTVNFAIGVGANLTVISGVTGEDGQATAEMTSLKAGVYPVTASVNGKDIVKETTFTADNTTAEITDANLVIGPDNSPANGTSANGVTVVVTDANGNFVPDASVDFIVENGAVMTTLIGTTGADGKATAEVTSLKAGSYRVTATVNRKAISKNTTFIGDTTTSEITDANLTVSPDNSPANGLDKNIVVAVVTDAQGNVVSNAEVEFSVADGAVINTLIGTTGAQGKATAEVTSLVASKYVVTAKVNGNTTSRVTTFIADGSTAEITSANLTIEPDNSIANGMAKNGVTAVVTDMQGNRVPDAGVTFTVQNGANITTLIGTTGTDGKATAEVSSTTAGTYTVTATVNGTSTQKDTHFVADSSTADITDANLFIDPDNAPANGRTANGVTAIVTDSTGNVVPDASVTFTVAEGAAITTLIGITGADGKATAEVISRKAGSYIVTASVNDHHASKETHFVADESTAEITDTNLIISPDNSVANGVATNGVTAIVTDAEGNLVPQLAVTFSVNEGAVITTIAGTTDANGKATAEVTSLKAGAYIVTATVNNSETHKNTHFMADESTAEIIDANLTIVADNALANGTEKNSVIATVTDAQGNLVADAAVTFTVDEGATITTIVGITGADGKATAEVTSTTAGTYQVVAMVNGKTATKGTTFVADGTTAEIMDANLIINPDNSPANGIDKNGVTAVVTDAWGNLVPDATVSFTVESGATITAITGITGADGMATAEVTSLTAGTYIVTASVNGNVVHKNSTFIADSATAEITDANLMITADGAVANGEAKNGATATVTDVNNNPVPGVDVIFTIAEGAVINTVQGTTDAQGIAIAEITSTTSGSFIVKAGVAGSASFAQKTTNFVADTTTALVTQVLLEGETTNKLANGEDSFIFHASVTDANGNVISGIPVVWAQSHEDKALITQSSLSDENGIATAELTSSRVEALNIQVSASTNNGQSVSADKSVSFNEQMVKMFGATTDAVNNKAISQARVEIYKPGDSTPSYVTNSTEDGKYSLDISQGIYQVKAIKTGYISLDIEINVADVISYEKNFVMSPLLDGDAARIVLTWESKPEDLDSHLYVPTESGSRVVVNFGAKKPAGADAVLDVDARAGFGPETITISKFHNGEYCYRVHRYTNAGLMSGAKVKLYVSDGSEYTYSIEDAAGELLDTHNNWMVFKMNVSNGDVTINQTQNTGISNSCS